MKTPKVKMLRLLLYFMEERQKVYLKRQAGEPWPWTSDPILQRWRFCCTYRENDRVTQWVRDEWCKPYAGHKNLWFALCLARQVNWPDTLREIGFPEEWNPRHVLHVMNKRAERGEKVYTSAYMLPSRGETSKPRYTVMRVLNPLFRAVASGKSYPPWEDGKHIEEVRLEAAFDWLLPFYGWGRFLTYEVVTDLRHTRYLCHVSDIMTWANAGPGAQRGLNRLYGRDLQSHQGADQLLDEMRWVLDWLMRARDVRVLPTLEMRDVEHCLCELDKYCRAQERLATGKMIGLERFAPPGLV
jgi:hypothetical protein